MRYWMLTISIQYRMMVLDDGIGYWISENKKINLLIIINFKFQIINYKVCDLREETFQIKFKKEKYYTF